MIKYLKDLGLESFSGQARLFPLPNLVMFPFAQQPLHLFEPRYRQLMSDALKDDRLITMSLLRPDWEENYHNCPPIYPTVCVGRIFQEQLLPDGRYNLLLHGLTRARILEELPKDKSCLYRRARIELLGDIDPTDVALEEKLIKQLAEKVWSWFCNQKEALTQVSRFFDGSYKLGAVCDIFSYVLPLGMEKKQELLTELDVVKRARLLLASLGGQFPPGFSEN